MLQKLQNNPEATALTTALFYREERKVGDFNQSIKQISRRASKNKARCTNTIEELAKRFYHIFV